MDFVAGDARPPFLPVDVEIVQVSIPIAEIGQEGGPLFLYQGVLVALETKSIHLRVIRIVELLHKEVLKILEHF